MRRTWLRLALLATLAADIGVLLAWMVADLEEGCEYPENPVGGWRCGWLRDIDFSDLLLICAVVTCAVLIVVVRWWRSEFR